MFINSLPTLFTFTDFINPIETVLILVSLLLLVHFSTREALYDRAWPAAPTPYQALLNIWLGQAPLWKAFWPFFIFVNGVFLYIDYRIMNVTFTIASWKTVHGMLFIPVIWWIVSVWRCAKYTRYRLANTLAKTLTLYLLFDCFLRFVIRAYYPNSFFDCRLLVMEYGDCF